MPAIDLYTTSKIGKTVVATVDSVTPYDFIYGSFNTQFSQFPIPSLLVLWPEKDVYLRQFRYSQVASRPTMNTNDFLLYANQYWPILIKDKDFLLAMIRPSGTDDGLVYATSVSHLWIA